MLWPTSAGRGDSIATSVGEYYLISYSIREDILSILLNAFAEAATIHS